MARKITHPEGLKEVNAIEVNEEIRTFVSNLAKDVDSEKTDRAVWEKNIDRGIDLRYGIRAEKTHPWKKCANYSIPLIDTHINQQKPAYVGLAAARPVCTFEPFGGEDIEPAKKREVLFDWRMRTKVKYFKHYCIGVDKMLEQGSVIFKTVWNYTTRNYTEEWDLEDFEDNVINALSDERTKDGMIAQILIEELGIDPDFEENIEAIEKAIAEFREGKTKFEMKLIEVENNQPEVTACSLREDVILPTDTTDIQWARFIANPFWRTTTQIKIAMRDEKYETYDDNTIGSWGNKEKHHTAAGSEIDDVIELVETCCWYDVNGDDIKERCIATYPESSPQDVLRFIEVPYDHGLFPYEEVRRELNDVGCYTSRGIPILDADYQRGISTAVNQAEDNGTIMNRPVIVMRRNTVTNIKNRRYVPGETVETTGSPADYEIRQMSNISQPMLFQFAQYLKSWADQRIGSISRGLTDTTNLPGAGERGKKTKKEIDIIEGMQGDVTSLDLLIFQMQMSRVYYQIDALYNQYGDEEEEIIITGQKSQKITRRESQGKWNIIPNGRLDNTNPAMRVSKAWNLFRIFQGDEDIKQDELKRFFFGEYDEKLTKKLMYTPEEKQKREQFQQQLLEQLKKKAIAEGIDLKQVDIMMDLYKETVIAQIHGRKFAPDEKEGKKKSKVEETRP